MSTITFRTLQRIPLRGLLKQLSVSDVRVTVHGNPTLTVSACKVEPVPESEIKKGPAKDLSTLPVYNPFIHKSGDRVVVDRNGEMIEVIVP